MEKTDSPDSVGVEQDDWWSFVNSDKFWKGLLVLGILLNVVVVFTSAFGHDTHVRLAEDENGALVWGHTRPIDSQASDSAYAPTSDHFEVDFTPSQFGEVGIQALSLVWMLLLVGVAVAAIRIAGAGNEGATRNGWRAAALVAIYPTFLFSTGRAYYEPLIAGLIVIGVLSLLQRSAEVPRPIRALGVLVSTGMFSLVLMVKGVNPLYCIGFGAALALFFGVDEFASNLRRITRRPAVAGSLTAGGVFLAMVGLGLSGGGGTLSVIGEQTGRFAFALLVSAFDVILIYSLFGMVLWPFICPALKIIREVEDLRATFLTVIIVGFTTAIIVYIAALWTFESVRWNAEWPWVMWTMGNNGRYVSLVMIPALMLLARLKVLDPELPSLTDPGEKAPALALGILLIIPIALLASFHGQTFWTEDAGEFLADNMDDGDDLLFIDEATLGMHYLYTFHTEVDLDNSRNITGHWRAPESGWQAELADGLTFPNRGNLSNVEWVVLAPGLDWQNPPEGWSVATKGEADFMNGGGEWTIWTTHA
uniref:Glycosyltransferase RgtA/B/C/D-like domain-containing protein n=1 Tax=uncultured marine group II/III euryarchaeote KM3_178_D06 TaxID=1457940 RepID=A0A075GPM6_9EURY|nr:hypothetical protein [uncultured marine group II/III euryarchaeote KM3_178_D06]